MQKLKITFWFIWETIILSVKPIAVKVIKCENEEERGHNPSYSLHDTKEQERIKSDKKQKVKTEIEELRHDMKDISVKLVNALEEINRMKTNMIEMKEHIRYD